MHSQFRENSCNSWEIKKNHKLCQSFGTLTKSIKLIINYF